MVPLRQSVILSLYSSTLWKREGSILALGSPLPTPFIGIWCHTFILMCVRPASLPKPGAQRSPLAAVSRTPQGLSLFSRTLR